MSFSTKEKESLFLVLLELSQLWKSLSTSCVLEFELLNSKISIHHYFLCPQRWVFGSFRWAKHGQSPASANYTSCSLLSSYQWCPEVVKVEGNLLSPLLAVHKSQFLVHQIKRLNSACYYNFSSSKGKRKSVPQNHIKFLFFFLRQSFFFFFVFLLKTQWVWSWHEVK